MLKTVCILRDDWNIYMIFFLPSSVPCGGTYNATSTPQNASSPHLSNIRRPYSTCTWVIAAPPQQQVQITVWDLQLPSQDCSQSYLELQDSVQVKTPQMVAVTSANTARNKVVPKSSPLTPRIVFSQEETKPSLLHATSLNDLLWESHFQTILWLRIVWVSC